MWRFGTGEAVGKREGGLGVQSKPAPRIEFFLPLPWSNTSLFSKRSLEDQAVWFGGFGGGVQSLASYLLNF